MPDRLLFVSFIILIWIVRLTHITSWWRWRQWRQQQWWWSNCCFCEVLRHDSVYVCAMEICHEMRLVYLSLSCAYKRSVKGHSKYRRLEGQHTQHILEHNNRSAYAHTGVFKICTVCGTSMSRTSNTKANKQVTINIQHLYFEHRPKSRCQVLNAFHKTKQKKQRKNEYDSLIERNWNAYHFSAVAIDVRLLRKFCIETLSAILTL